MKCSKLIALGPVFCLTMACGQVDDFDNNGYSEAMPYRTVQAVSYPADEALPYTTSNRSQNSNVVMHEIKNPQNGMVIAHIPLPSYWKMASNGFEGPGGAKVTEHQGATINIQQTGISDVDQLIEYQITPNLKNANIKILNSFDIPSITENDQQVGQQYWTPFPVQKYHQTRGMKMKSPDGETGLMIFHFTKTISNYGSFATYYTHFVDTDEHHYDQVKQEIIYGLSHMKPTPQAVAAFNQKEQQRSNVAYANHRSRMKSNQDHFNAMNKIHNDTYNHINDLSMESFRRRSEMTDRMQDKAVDMTLERNAMIDPGSGNTVKVEGHYKYYFINNDGRYIGTDDAFYNPANDPNIGHMGWRKLRGAN